MCSGCGSGCGLHEKCLSLGTVSSDGKVDDDMFDDLIEDDD